VQIRRGRWVWPTRRDWRLRIALGPAAASVGGPIGMGIGNGWHDAGVLVLTWLLTWLVVAALATFFVVQYRTGQRDDPPDERPREPH
jgi:hypothetical protein